MDAETLLFLKLAEKCNFAKIPRCLMHQIAIQKAKNSTCYWQLLTKKGFV